MVKRIESLERHLWKNPIKNVRPKPFLGNEIFPMDPDSPVASEAKEVLKRFYIEKRKDETDLNKLKNFVLNPDKQLLVIWGDVGIGKSWFARYELICGELTDITFENPFYAGVINILGGGVISDEDSIYRQICLILESYFNHFYKSVKDALLEYAKYRAKKQVGGESSEEDLSFNAASLLNEWLPSNYTREYAEILLAALAYKKNPLLFLIIDNIDRAGETEQSILLNTARKILYNNRIRLIIPLRRSNSLLSDRFKGLKEQSYDEMTLSALELDLMLKKRFNFSKYGGDLSREPIIVDDDYVTTFPKLFKLFISSESGTLLQAIAGKNAREAILMVDRLIHSDQLRGLENISNNQYAIAALMLSDSTQIDPLSPYLINLFNNEEPYLQGNSLIRFRILEYFYRHESVFVGSNHFLRYMDRLGYTGDRLKNVLSLMTGMSMIYSQKGIVAEKFDDLDLTQLGSFEITDIGKAYWETVIRLQWYYVCVKRGMLWPEKFINIDEEVPGRQYITHSNLCRFIKDEENEERHRIRTWEGQHGKMEVTLNSPSEVAKRALRGRDERFLNGSNNKR